VDSCRHVPYSWPIQNASSERSGDSTEPVLLDVRQKEVVLVCKPFVIATDFLYDAVRSHAERAFRIMIA
jgi:hypothetical protein